MSKRVILVANRGYAIYSSRALLIEKLIKKKYSVIVLSVDDEYKSKIESLGATFYPINVNRGGLSILSDYKLYSLLKEIYNELKPDLIHHFHSKPVILGSKAARMVLGKQVKIVNTITGLGHAFIDGGINKVLASLGYKLLRKRSDCTIFQNPDDLNLFLKNMWVIKEKSQLIISSGVDLTKFKPKENNISSKKVLMAGRLLWQKGVKEYVEAVNVLKEKYSEWQFDLAGEFDLAHPDSVPKSYFTSQRSSVNLKGYIANMHEQIHDYELIVLPSYREGTPRIILEAAACCIPSIGADVPGTREAILNNVTGFLVPVKSITCLTDKIEELIIDSELRTQMGRNAFDRVKKYFGLENITDKQVSIYDRLLNE